MLFVIDPNAGVLSTGDALRAITVVILSIISYFLRRSMSTIDNATKEIEALKTKVAVLLDRDRRKRLEDYEREDGIS